MRCPRLIPTRLRLIFSSTYPYVLLGGGGSSTDGTIIHPYDPCVKPCGACKDLLVISNAVTPCGSFIAS